MGVFCFFVNAQICDSTGAIKVTLWDRVAEQVDQDSLNEQVILFKGCKVGSFGGRSLSATANFAVTPTDNKQCRQILEWAQSLRWNFSDIPTLTTYNGVSGLGGDAIRYNVRESGAKCELELKDDEPMYFDLVATVTAISHSREYVPIYKACPDPNNKVITFIFVYCMAVVTS